ncbi:hypothetical protein PBY51_011058 [Eleginops maclovinus]|uniref:Uncharacterized protein n=1 Tax=Eleginops maclovinus TaxID=56733 RepID=A0AAN7XBY0_ELEMC|nr:hypothetical protein PBY51_011058 [Eleginops maclovinus]
MHATQKGQPGLRPLGACRRRLHPPCQQVASGAVGADFSHSLRCCNVTENQHNSSCRSYIILCCFYSHSSTASLVLLM